MRISEKKKIALYESISEPIMKKRIRIQQQKGLYHADDLDAMLFKLTSDIWKEVTDTLGIQG